ncbi:MAG TPA: hypothetical protein V6D22_05885 [Candidatus Obscuribacterales bacterium]
MGEPISKAPINGVLSCWFDDEPAQGDQTPVDVQPTYPHPQVATPAPQTHSSPQPVAPQAIQPQALPYDGQQAMSSLLNLMEAIHDRHMLPDIMVPAAGRHEAPLMRPENDAKPAQAIPQPSAPTYRPSFQELICRIYQSPESRSYQWLQMQGLAIEFDQRAVSLEQRWNTDGSFCAVRRTANGYSHTVMLKADGSCAGERITGPSGPIAQFNSTGNVVTSEMSNSFVARQIA